jgi:iron complex outermembrane receptor protein
MPTSRPSARTLRSLQACCLLLPLLASAQTAPDTSVEAPLELPQFTVVSGADEGWTAASSMSGTRTNVPIQNLPRSVQVLTSEFLSDLGATTLSDSVAFLTGVQSQGGQDAVFDNNTFVVRGMRQNRHYRDGVREAFFGMINDSASVDRVESLRGPSSLLAGVSEPGGMINQISKRPRSQAASSVKLTTGSFNFLRSEADVSLPVNRKFALRAVGAYQENESWRDWEAGRRTVGYLTGVYRFSPDTVLSARAEAINAHTTPAIAIPNYRLPGGTTSVIGYVPEDILPWDFNPFGPTSQRDHETYRASADLQHRINDTFSLRAAVLWSKSDRRDNRPSASATTIYTRYLNPLLGNVAGNIVPDEIRWGATLDDENWHIWTYQADLRGVFEYAGLKHEALLGVERIESRNWRERWDTPNSTGTTPSTNPNALTRYKFPTAATGAIAAGGWQPAWTELTDRSRYTTANVYVDQTTTRNAVSFTNVISTKNEKWHALAGARYDEGENNALSGASINAIAPSAFPKESATSETLGLLYRPWSALSVYASYSTSFSGVPSGLDIFNQLLDKPEEGSSREIGIKSSLLNGKLGIEAAVFELDRTNVRRQLTDAEQIAIIGTTVSGARYAQDAGEEAKGFEVQVLYSPVRGYLISGTYSNIDARLAKTENVARIGGPIVGRGKQSGSIFQKYTFQSGKLKDLYFTNGVIWVDGSRPDSISNTTGLVQNYVPGYTRLDFGVGYPFKFNGHRYTVTATVRNATDEQYYEGYQSKGDPRALRLSVTARF